MDEAHLATAFRYLHLTPVKAKLAVHPRAWPWSSTRACLNGVADGLTSMEAMRARLPDMAALVDLGAAPGTGPAVRDAESIGRPRGSPQFIASLEARTARKLQAKKRGRKPRRVELNALSPEFEPAAQHVIAVERSRAGGDLSGQPMLRNRVKRVLPGSFT